MMYFGQEWYKGRRFPPSADALAARPLWIKYVVRSDVNARPQWLRFVPNGTGLDFFGPYDGTDRPEASARFSSPAAAQSWADRWSDVPGVWRVVARVAAPSRRIP